MRKSTKIISYKDQIHQFYAEKPQILKILIKTCPVDLIFNELFCTDFLGLKIIFWS